MTVVACNLPAGLLIEHGGVELRINGAHAGVDLDNLPKNGMMGDSEVLASGYGLTTLDGKEAEALDAWWKAVTEAPDGSALIHPFAPIASGSLQRFKSEKDARAEVNKASGMAIGGLDPAKDLPPGVEPGDDKKKV